MKTRDDGTIAVRADEVFDEHAVEVFLRKHLPGLPDDGLSVRQFAAGASNLTYLLTVGSWEGVLRRAPKGPLPPKAHDMRREFLFLEKLHPVFSLAPRPFLFSDDTATMGCPFYIMERKQGVVLNDVFPGNVDASPAHCQSIPHAVIDTLVALHEIDYEQAGFQSFGRPDEVHLAALAKLELDGPH